MNGLYNTGFNPNPSTILGSMKLCVAPISTKNERTGRNREQLERACEDIESAVGESGFCRLSRSSRSDRKMTHGYGG